METPELDKMAEVADLSHQIGFFLDWLEEQGIRLGKYVALLDPPERFLVVECPSCSEDCWRVEDVNSLSLRGGLGRYHYETEEAAHAAAAVLEDDRKAKAEENPVFQQAYDRKEDLLARYFHIDLKKVDKEKDALLEAHRAAQR